MYILSLEWVDLQLKHIWTVHLQRGLEQPVGEEEMRRVKSAIFRIRSAIAR